MRPVFDASGAVVSLDVLNALCAVGRGGASATAAFTGPAGETIRYGFDAGVLVALEAPPEMSPAEVLIRSGKVQRATYEALTVGDFEDRYAVAAASGVLSKREALWGIKIAAIETLARVLGWTEGSYTFEEGPAAPMQPAFRLAVDHWILELFLRSSDRAFVLRKIGATDIPIARVDGFAEGFGALGLTADADAVAEGIDGRRTIEQIVKRSRSDEFATLKLLGALMALGLIHPILETPPAALTRPAEPAPGAPPIDDDLEETVVAGAAPTTFELELPHPTGAGPEPAPSVEAETDVERVPAPDETIARADARVRALEPEAAARTVDPEPSFPPVPPPREPILSEGGDLGAAPETDDFAASESAGEAPLVSVPLFALTSPDEIAAEREVELAPAVEEAPPPRQGAGLALALIAVAAVAAGIFLASRRSRPVPGGTSAGPAVQAPAPLERPSSGRAQPSPPPQSSSEIVVSKEPEVRRPAAPVPKPAPRRASNGGRWSALAEAGRRTFEHPGSRRYAIQLELACEESTLEKAVAADTGGRRIWIAPFSFRGRSCYRVLWGKYADLASAREGKRTIPEVFLRDGNRPAIVALGSAGGGR